MIRTIAPFPTLLLSSILLLSGCDRGPSSGVTVSTSAASGGDAGPPWFEEIAAKAGINFTHKSGHANRHYMPEIMGGGAALFDMDNDGDLDAYLVQSGSLTEDRAQQPGNMLFRNRGDGTFEDVTAGSGTDDRGYGMGVACGDYDNDGDVDLYVTNVGRNVMLRNDGGGKFSDVTSLTNTGHDGWGTSAAFVDYDKDGWLDLYVCNYLNWSTSTEIDCYNDMGAPDYCSPKNYNAPAIDVLYHNNGDGTFTDVTESSGIALAFGTGLGVVCGDFNADGEIDIFVANDGMENILWINHGPSASPRFTNEAMMAGCALDQEGKAKAGMGVTASDVDDDGDLDLLVCNLNRESDSFYRNEGAYFADRTAVSGLGAASRPMTRFGMAWLDFDNDGYVDLYQANGRVMRQSRLFSDDPFAEPNMLFRGQAGGRFRELHPRGGTRELLVATSRAAAFGDLDNDGAIDVLLVNRDGPAHLLHNIAPPGAPGGPGGRGNWIGFAVMDEHGRDAFGATVTFKRGERTITRDVRAAYSYLASNDPRVHAGLGEATEVSDVTVRWMDGATQQFGALPAGKYHTLRRG